MAQTEQNKYGPILQHYNLKVNYVEDFGKVKKIHTNSGNYALKACSRTMKSDFPRFIQTLYQKGFNRAVPIIPTANGHFLSHYNQQYYYLMPWFVNESKTERNIKHEQLFKELARMHYITVKESRFEEKDITHHYEMVKKKWEKANTILDEFIEKAEHSWYMSPFELQMCTYYHETVQAAQFARIKLDEWYEIITEKKAFRSVINHGNVSASHFVNDEKGHGYFLNFEKASYASPINDLVSFYYRTLRTYPVLCNECLEWYVTYTNQFPLRKEELLLFLSYLTFPEPIVRCILNYTSKRNEKSEREHVQLLQKSYWLNKNIEYVAMNIVRFEQNKEEQEEESHT